jgi:hypothetical protein
VRELENTIERAVALETGPEISANVLPDRVARAVGLGGLNGHGETPQFPPEGIDFERAICDTEKGYLQAALEKSNGCGPRRRTAKDQLPFVPALREEAQFVICVAAVRFLLRPIAQHDVKGRAQVGHMRETIREDAKRRK